MSKTSSMDASHYECHQSSKGLSKDLLLVVFALMYLRLLIGTLPPGVAPTLASLTMLILLALLWMIFLITPHIQARVRWLFLSILALLWVSAISWVATSPPNNFEAFAFVLRLVFLLGWLHFSSLTLVRYKGIMMLFNWCRFAIWLGAVVALVQIIVFPSIYQILGDIRAFGTMAHPVPFGMFSFVALVYCEVVRIKLARRRKFSDWALIAAALLAIYLASAQTAWIMLVIFLFFLGLGKLPTIYRYVIGPLFAGLCLGLLYIIPFTRDLFSFVTIFSQFGDIATDRFSYELVSDSVAWRVVNWKLSIVQMWPQWHTGLGPGQAEYFNYFQKTLHSLPLEILVELGVFGVVALIACFWNIWRIVAFKDHESAQDVKAKQVARSMLLSVLATACLSVTLLEQSLLLQVLLSVVLVASVPTSKLNERY